MAKEVSQVESVPTAQMVLRATARKPEPSFTRSRLAPKDFRQFWHSVTESGIGISQKLAES
jgi:hypothetical protein